MKHLFFDLDRTLWDFESNSERALEKIYHEFGLDNHLRSFRSFHTKYKKINAEYWYLYSQGKMDKATLRVVRFRDTLRAFDYSNDQLAIELAEAYVNFSPYQTQLFPKTIEVLNELKDNGHPMHIITNGFKEVQFIKLRESKLIDYFDVILCSEEVGQSKPAKAVFDRALDMAGTTAEKSIMIGDSYQADIVGAENAGIKAVLFDPTREHKVGFHPYHIHALDQLPGIIPLI